MFFTRPILPRLAILSGATRSSESLSPTSTLREKDGLADNTKDGLQRVDQCPTPVDPAPAILRSSPVSSLRNEIHNDPTSPSEIPALSISTVWFAHIGAALALFLATTDATIVSTSLPTIVAQLHGSDSEYSWVGVAYLLTQTGCQPFWGRLAALTGRKNLLYGSIVIFMLGSLLCGLARTMTWLIIARGLAGVGGGGIVACVWVITSEIVPEESRAKWSQALSVTWSCSAIAGPLLGGFFSDGSVASSNWRWAFLLNLPVGSLSLIILVWALWDVPVANRKSSSWQTFYRTFDFIGLLLFIGGTVLLVLGFSFASDIGWSSAMTISFLLVGLSALAGGAVYECWTTREPLFPASIFKDPTISLTLVIVFLHSFVFNIGTFYLALYYQAVNGSTPLQAGILMLPYSLGSSLASMPAAWFISYWQKRTKTIGGQKSVTSLGLLISTVGFGVLISLNAHASPALQEISPLLAGVGLGMLFHAPYQIFSLNLPERDLACATGAFFLIRFTGSTTGLAIAGAVFDQGLRQYLPAGYQLQMAGSSLNLRGLADLQPTDLRLAALRAVSRSITNIWIMCTPCLGVALAASILLRTIRTRVKEDDGGPMVQSAAPSADLQQSEA